MEILYYSALSLEKNSFAIESTGWALVYIGLLGKMVFYLFPQLRKYRPLLPYLVDDDDSSSESVIPLE
jgi:hypothetical protein